MTLERTNNNAILVDQLSGEYVVFDETQAYEVGRTFYFLVAEAMVEAYSEHYLEAL